MPEAGAVEVPEDLDPAEVLSLLFTYMTAYQVLHRTAKVKSGERCSCTARPAGLAPRFSSSAPGRGEHFRDRLGARPRRG